MEAQGTPESAVRRAWKRVVSFERETSVGPPAIFAVLAVALLVYNHVEDRVSDLVFWLGLALIASVFCWMVQNERRQSKAIERRDRRDAVTGVLNRVALQADLDELLGLSQERRVLVLLELDGVAAYRDRFGFEAGDEVLRNFAREMTSVLDQLGGTAYRIDGSQFCALVPAGGHEPGEIVTAISTTTEKDDGETPISCSHGDVTLPDDASDPDRAIQVAGQRLASHKQRQRRSAKRQAHDVLMAVLSARRPELRAHLRAVAFRAIAIGRRLGVGRDQLDDIVFAAELQDIGLLTVPESILEKQTRLNRFESELIRGHPPAGAGIISSAPALASVATLVRSSYEHFDGSGYPDGLAGEAIPLGSRIISVCVAFAALTSKRPYRPAQSSEEALAELRRCAGTQFDPQVVEALAEDLDGEVTPPAPAPGPPLEAGDGPPASPSFAGAT